MLVVKVFSLKSYQISVQYSTTSVIQETDTMARRPWESGINRLTGKTAPSSMSGRKQPLGTSEAPKELNPSILPGERSQYGPSSQLPASQKKKSRRLSRKGAEPGARENKVEEAKSTPRNVKEIRANRDRKRIGMSSIVRPRSDASKSTKSAAMGKAKNKALKENENCPQNRRQTQIIEAGNLYRYERRRKSPRKIKGNQR